MKVATWVCTLWAAGLTAQTDSLPALPEIQVQIPLDSLVLDTVWRDAVWTWSGPCPTQRLNVRLVDRETGQVAQRQLPCTRIAPAAPGYVAPERFETDLTFTREQVAAWRWTAEAACFPPSNMRDLETAEAAWDALIFEKDQLEAMVRWAATRCLAPAMVRRCIERIGSESRRLELLKALAEQCSDASAIDVTGLFILRSTREAAMQVVEK